MLQSDRMDTRLDLYSGVSPQMGWLNRLFFFVSDICSKCSECLFSFPSLARLLFIRVLDSLVFFQFHTLAWEGPRPPCRAPGAQALRAIFLTPARFDVPL